MEGDNLNFGARHPGWNNSVDNGGTPKMPFEMRPIESFTQNQQTIEVVKMLARGEVPRNTAQAAVWHLQDGLSWQELARKDRVRLSNGYTEKSFAPHEIALAARVVAEASRRARSSQDTEDPEKYDSLSQN